MTCTDGESEAIGRWRAGVRVTRGLTQDQLAEAAGVSVGTVLRAEAGKGMTETNLRALAQALGVAARDYFDPQGYAAPVPAVAAEPRP